MGGKPVLVLACVVAVWLLLAPAALADLVVTDSSPNIGDRGTTVQCTISGAFRHPTGAHVFLPTFSLSNIEGPTFIWGTTTGIDEATGAEAYVTFSIPGGAPFGWYNIEAAQRYQLSLLGIWQEYEERGGVDDVFLVARRPTVTSTNPASASAGSGDLTLTVYGTGFFSMLPLMARTSTVCLDGEALVTEFNSATVLTATIPAARLAVPRTVQLTVVNPDMLADGTDFVSAPYAFTIGATSPTITALSRTSATVGAAGFALGVTGTGFLTGAGGAIVRWNEAELATTRDSATELTAAVPASLLATAGSASITVRNGGAAAPVSNSLTFTIGAAAPLITAITPAQAWAGCVKTGVTLTAGGSGFVSGAHVMFGTVEKAATTFVSATLLTVPLLPGDITTPGTIKVGVTNPPFPPGTPSVATQVLVVQAETTDPTVGISGADSAWHNAPVTLTFAAADAQSGVQKIQYMAPPGVPSWTDGTSLTVPTTSQGHVAVSVRALDWCDRVGTATTTVNIDTTRPETATLGDATVKKGKIATLKHRVSEPSDLSPAADVRIVIKRRSGSTAKTIELPAVAMNRNLFCRFTCKLRTGTYKWYVYATDLAGNTQANIANANLTVK